MSAHLFVVHFPVALILVGAAADALGVATARAALRQHATALLVLGAAAALLAFFTGQGALIAAAPRLDPGSGALELHTQWGAVGVWLLAALGALRVLWRRRLEGSAGLGLLAAALASAVVVTVISLSGTAIAHAG